ncbi:MAG TPA: EamA family transporter [Acidimicrobiia bacterium]
MAIVAAVLFGVSGVVAADAFESVDPVVVAQYRSIGAAVILVGVAYARRQTRTAGMRFDLVLMGGLLAGVTITYYWAIDRLGVGPGVTLQFLGPSLVLVWMRVVQRRTVPAAAWMAAGAAVAGTALMTRAWDLDGLDPIGVLAGLGAAATFAGYLIVGERLGRRAPGLTIAAAGFAVSALLWVLAVPVSIPDVSGTVWAQLIWVAVGGTAAPFLLEIAALRHADPGRVGVIATAEPVVAAGVAWVALGQALIAAQVVGGILVVAAIAIIQQVTHAVAPDAPTPQVV